MATGIFIYISPKDQLEKNHNKEALILLPTRKSELLLEQQAIGTEFIPQSPIKYTGILCTLDLCQCYRVLYKSGSNNSSTFAL